MPFPPILDNTMPATAQTTTKTIGETLKNTDSRNTPRKRTSVALSTTAFFQSFRTALKISTHTQTRMPAKALLTAGTSEKLVRIPAMRVMMITDGNTMPREATTPPTVPASL